MAVRLFFDDRRVEEKIDSSLQVRSLVIGLIDRAGEVDELLPKVAPAFTGSDIFLDHPKAPVDSGQRGFETVQMMEEVIGACDVIEKLQFSTNIAKLIFIGQASGLDFEDGDLIDQFAGALDPGVLIRMIDQYGLNTRDLEDLVYRRSGLLGAPQISSARTLRASSEPFGMSENDAATRAELIRGGWLGLMLDETENRRAALSVAASPAKFRCSPCFVTTICQNQNDRASCQ